MSAPGSDLVFVGDVHLDRDDATLPAFVQFLDRLAGSAARVVLMGDLFNLWIGRHELEQPHQREVLDRLIGLRRRGVVVRYLEGNRDYGIRSSYAGTALDDASDEGIVETQGPLSLYATHGDLVNEGDRQYRAWRRFSRSSPVWWIFNRIPRTRRLALAERLERRLRATNLDMKRAFPESTVRAFAARRFAEGHGAVVLGHFHVEKDTTAAPPSPPGRILVVPEWKGSRRHLRVTADGEAGFVDS